MEQFFYCTMTVLHMYYDRCNGRFKNAQTELTSYTISVKFKTLICDVRFFRLFLTYALHI